MIVVVSLEWPLVFYLFRQTNTWIDYIMLDWIRFWKQRGEDD